MSEAFRDPLDLREQLTRIDNLLADTQKKQREYQLAPWQLVITSLGAGAAIFATRATFFKLLG